MSIYTNLKSTRTKNRLKVFIFLLLLLVIVIAAGFVIYKKSKENLVIAGQVSEINKDLDLLIHDFDSNLPDPTITDSSTGLNNCSDLSGINNVQGRNMLPILYYHHIGNDSNPSNNPNDVNEVDTNNFDQQMKYLVDNGYTTIDVPTWIYYYNCGIPAPEKTVVLTFDDGYLDFYNNAFPILQKYNLAAEVFIPSGLIDSSQYYMSLKQVKELLASSLITIGSHTITHPYLTKISLDDVNKEVTVSKRFLEDNLGIKITDFAYPFGTFNYAVVDAVKAANYSYAFTVDYQRSAWKDDMFRIPRIRVSHTTSMNDFMKML